MLVCTPLTGHILPVGEDWLHHRSQCVSGLLDHGYYNPVYLQVRFLITISDGELSIHI